MYTLAAVITLLCIGVAHASVCCFPKQYEANQGILKGTVKNGQLSMMFGTIHYWFDGVSRRETFLEELNVDGVDTKVTVIKDYNVTNTKYVISGDRCIQKSLTPFKEGCIADSATHLVSSNYGLTGSGMNFDVYDNSVSTVMSYLISTQDCFPMFDIAALPRGASPYMQIAMLYNFTQGIQDFTVFDIPAICKPSTPIGK